MDERLLNLLIILFLICIAVITIFKLTKKKRYDFGEAEDTAYKLEFLIQGVINALNDILNRNISEFNLNKVESLKREENKVLLREALRFCNHGDIGAKEYVIDYIKEILQKKFKINESNIDRVISFEENELTAQDKFEILLQQYKKIFNYNALKEIILKYRLDEINSDGYYKIDSNDINSIYHTESFNIEYIDKLDIVARKVYQKSNGLSVVDELRNMIVDGIAGGISGIPEGFFFYDLEKIEYVKQEKLNSYDSIWILFQGKEIRLSFLSFDSNRELIRTCKNIYRYNNPGQLSESKGYILNESRDGARITVFRPKFSAGWAFIVRKYDSLEKKTLEACITDKGFENVISVLELLVKGELVMMITGEMKCGKTSLLMAIIGILKKTSSVRTFEQIFELYINKYFPEMNVLSLRKIDSISTSETFSIIRKTDGKVLIMGEITSHEEANQMMEINQINQETTVGTAHMPTVEKLIDYFTDAKLVEGKYNDVKRAEKKVVETLNIDVHMRNDDGHRYIERITEIIPLDEEEYPEDVNEAMKEYFRRSTMNKTYRTVDILRFENGEYKITNSLSNKLMERIRKNLNAEDTIKYKNIFTLWEDQFE